MPRDEAQKTKNIRESRFRACSNRVSAIEVVRRLNDPTIHPHEHPGLHQKAATGNRISS
jgi:hypothetical protein